MSSGISSSTSCVFVSVYVCFTTCLLSPCGISAIVKHWWSQDWILLVKSIYTAHDTHQSCASTVTPWLALRASGPYHCARNTSSFYSYVAVPWLLPVTSVDWWYSNLPLLCLSPLHWKVMSPIISYYVEKEWCVCV